MLVTFQAPTKAQRCAILPYSHLERSMAFGGSHPEEDSGPKSPASMLKKTLGDFLAGALYREFRKFMRIMTTFLGKTHRNPS